MRKEFLIGIVVSVASLSWSASPEWQWSQEVAVGQKGLAKVKLPLETLSNAQASLGDLRLMAPNGEETAFFIDQPLAQAARRMYLELPIQKMENGKTILKGRVPTVFKESGFDTIALHTATPDFLKPVTLEASQDDKTWTVLFRNYPLFTQAGQSMSNAIVFPKGGWPFLRLTLDDSTTPPIRVQGISLMAEAKPLANLEAMPAAIQETSSDAHQTNVRLTLPADHLTLDSLVFQTSESTFRRSVTVSAKLFANGTFQEQVLGQGFIYRVSMGAKRAENLSILLSRQIPGREVVIHIENGDSRPLVLTGVTVKAVPAFLVFDAPQAGAYTLWVGNPTATPRNYDVAEMRNPLASAPAQTVVLKGLVKNTAYQSPEPLPQVSNEGIDIDVAPWKYRKPVTLTQNGIQRLELDLETLAHNNGRLAALRLVRKGKQLPYVIDQSGVMRDFKPQLESQTGLAGKSQWRIRLPYAGVPLSALRFTVQEPLFQRTMELYEEIQDERGEKLNQPLGQATWVRMNGETKEGFLVTLNRAPSTDQVFMETSNGDNAPIHLISVQGYYPTQSLVFKASADPGLFLYYGQNETAAPQYDLNLIANELINALPSQATLGAETVLKVQPWWEVPLPDNKLRHVFWMVMAAIVLALLIVIAKLLPEEKQAPSK